MFELIAKPLKYTVLAALMVFGAFGVVNFVSAHGGPVASGVIHSCVNNSSGEIKIVDATATCKNNQTPLDWNAQGQPGTNGTNGVSGWERVVEQAPLVDINTGVAVGLTIECSGSKKVLGGGSQTNADFVITMESYPLNDTSWFVRHLNVGDPVTNVLITGYAICADVN